MALAGEWRKRAWCNAHWRFAAIVFPDDVEATGILTTELIFNALGRVVRELSKGPSMVTDTAIDEALSRAAPFCCYAGGAGRLRSIAKAKRERKRQRAADRRLN